MLESTIATVYVGDMGISALTQDISATVYER
jgi:hypothetical protein